MNRSLIPSRALVLGLSLILCLTLAAQEPDLARPRGRHVVLIVLEGIDLPTWSSARACPAFGAWRSLGVTFSRALAQSDDPEAARAALLGGAGAGASSLAALTKLLDSFDRRRFFETDEGAYFQGIHETDHFAHGGEALAALRLWIDAGGGSFLAALRLRDGEPIPGATGQAMAQRAARLECSIGEFMSWFQDRPEFSETLIVVVADAAAQGPKAPEIPFWAVGGGLEPGLIEPDLAVAQFDLLPTLFAFLGRKAPVLPGRSLFELLRGRPVRDLVCESARSTLPEDFVPDLETIAREVRSPAEVLLQHDHFRLLHDRRRDAWQLFDLDTDPDAARDLAATEPQVLREMRGRLEHWLRIKSWRLLSSRMGALR